MAPPSFHERAIHLFTTGQYSDLEVRCADVCLKVHKNVVCVQSEWLAKAVEEGRFLEGTTNVIMMHEDNPEAVRAMVEFLYFGDYNLVREEHHCEGDEMLGHLDVYAIADMTLNEDLKLIAEAKLSCMVNQHFESGMFPAVVKKCYDVSPPGDRGSRLREMIVDAVAQNAVKVFAAESDFRDMIESVAAFGADLSSALAAKMTLTPTVKPPRPQFTAGRRLKCSLCSEYSYASIEYGNAPAWCPNGCSAPFAFGSPSPPTRLTDALTFGQHTRYLFQCSAGHLFEREAQVCRKCMFCNSDVVRMD